MIVVRVVMGTLKTLMVLGIFEYMAPGFSYEGTKALVGYLFTLGKG
jgi:hypothetical protein